VSNSICISVSKRNFRSYARLHHPSLTGGKTRTGGLPIPQPSGERNERASAETEKRTSRHEERTERARSGRELTAQAQTSSRRLHRATYTSLSSTFRRRNKTKPRRTPFMCQVGVHQSAPRRRLLLL
jgi:hypothetical protein